MRKLLETEQYVPRVLVTDKRAPTGAAQRVVMSSVEHRSHKRLNNRVENSHQDPLTGTGDASFHVAGSRPTILLGPRQDL